MSKWKGMLSAEPEGFLRTWSNWTSFWFSFPVVGSGAVVNICTDVICYCVSSVAFSYCIKYDFSDQVPVGWGTSACVVQACFFPSESLREADVRLPSPGRMEIILQDLPFDLDFFESHCSSWTRSGSIHMIYPVSSVKRKRPLISWVLAEGCFTSSCGVGIGKVPSGTVTFRVFPNSRVTMFAVSFALILESELWHQPKLEFCPWGQSTYQ